MNCVNLQSVAKEIQAEIRSNLDGVSFDAKSQDRPEKGEFMNHTHTIVGHFQAGEFMLLVTSSDKNISQVKHLLDK